MGVKDVTVTDLVTQLDGTLSLYGENFTKSSKVYINGEKQDSSFLNNTRIDLKDVTLQDGDLLEVSQVGSSDTIFRTSETYVYQGGKLMEKAQWEKWKEEQAAGENQDSEQNAEESGQ